MILSNFVVIFQYSVENDLYQYRTKFGSLLSGTHCQSFTQTVQYQLRFWIYFEQWNEERERDTLKLFELNSIVQSCYFEESSWQTKMYFIPNCSRIKFIMKNFLNWYYQFGNRIVSNNMNVNSTTDIFSAKQARPRQCLHYFYVLFVNSLVDAKFFLDFVLIWIIHVSSQIRLKNCVNNWRKHSNACDSKSMPMLNLFMQRVTLFLQ